MSEISTAPSDTRLSAQMPGYIHLREFCDILQETLFNRFPDNRVSYSMNLEDNRPNVSLQLGNNIIIFYVFGAMRQFEFVALESGYVNSRKINMRTSGNVDEQVKYAVEAIQRELGY